MNPLVLPETGPLAILPPNFTEHTWGDTRLPWQLYLTCAGKAHSVPSSWQPQSGHWKRQPTRDISCFWGGEGAPGRWKPPGRAKAPPPARGRHGQTGGRAGGEAPSSPHLGFPPWTSGKPAEPQAGGRSRLRLEERLPRLLPRPRQTLSPGRDLRARVRCLCPSLPPSQLSLRLLPRGKRPLWLRGS